MKQRNILIALKAAIAATDKKTWLRLQLVTKGQVAAGLEAPHQAWYLPEFAEVRRLIAEFAGVSAWKFYNWSMLQYYLEDNRRLGPTESESEGWESASGCWVTMSGANPISTPDTPIAL